LSLSNGERVGFSGTTEKVGSDFECLPPPNGHLGEGKIIDGV